VVGSERPASDWLADLMSDTYRVPALLVSGGLIRQANRASYDLFGELELGAHATSLFDPSCHAKLDDLLRREDPARATELQVVRPDSDPIAVHFLVLGRTERGRVVLAVAPPLAAYEDVNSRLMDANDALVNATRELSRRVHEVDAARRGLEQLRDLRETFIAAMAHDLRSPLQAILLNERLLRRSTAEGGGRHADRHADRVERSVGRMLRLIDTLLLAARLDATDPAMPVSILQLVDAAREAVDDLSPIAAEAGVRVVVASAGDGRVRGNRVWLAGIFSNLLVNALRYGPAGSVVEVSIDRAGGVVRSAVADRGPGVPREERETIFLRFVQGGDRPGSIGLGLFVCKRLVELHGGRIWVEDNPLGGARFVFELPAA
jgi:signal transduction histidine kinase